MKVNSNFVTGVSNLPNFRQEAVIPQVPHKADEHMSSEASMAARAYAMPQLNFGSVVNSKFRVLMLDAARREIDKIPVDQQEILRQAYNTVEHQGLNQVITKALKGLKNVFEIKTGKWRSLFTYGPNNTIVIGSVCKKQAQCLSAHEMNTAEQRLNSYAMAA